MLIAQDLMFASYANCTGLNLVSPHMLIAQDFMFASYANCTGLNLVSPRMLTAQDFMFASYANCIRLNFNCQSSFFTYLDLSPNAGLIVL